MIYLCERGIYRRPLKKEEALTEPPLFFFYWNYFTISTVMVVASESTDNQNDGVKMVLPLTVD